MLSEPWVLAIEGALLLLAASLAQRVPQAVVTVGRRLELTLAVLLVTLALLVPLLGYSRTGPERAASQPERVPAIRGVSTRPAPAQAEAAPRAFRAVDGRVAGGPAAPSVPPRPKADAALLESRHPVFEPRLAQAP